MGQGSATMLTTYTHTSICLQRTQKADTGKDAYYETAVENMMRAKSVTVCPRHIERKSYVKTTTGVKRHYDLKVKVGRPT
eukprot:5410885-Amphidinium_carterae.1